jgi:AAA domain
MELTLEFKQKVRLAILEARKNYTGSDTDFAKSKGLNAAVFSRLKSGEVEGIISNSNYITLGRDLQVNMTSDNWKVVRTKVYDQLEDSLNFCKEFSKAMIFVDECGIGKSFCTRHILRGMKNGFYIDCSQHKTRQQFIRALAKIVGVDNNGKYVDVKANLKYALLNIEKPIIAIDEAGDLDYTAFLEIKEIWNGTEKGCGMFMLGADGLKTKLENGFKNKKVGFAEIMDRFSDEIIKVVPTGKDDREAFFTELMTMVADANVKDKKEVPKLVRLCVKKGKKLRHLDTLIKMGA